MTSAISTSGLTRRYGVSRGGDARRDLDGARRSGAVTAVDRLSLQVNPGEIYAFLGLNGAGKTTTIRMLLGMLRPSAGSASIFGVRVRPGERAVWASVGYLVEKPSAYPELTVRENLEAARRLHHCADPRAVERAIERLGLSAYADRRAGALSQGNAQRLGLAKALLHQPRLLLLDEPSNGLDPAGVVEVRELLRELAQQGVTIFLSSHILAEVARLVSAVRSARIGIIHQGRLLEELDTVELERRSRKRLALATRAHDLPAARAALAAAGYAVEDGPDGTLLLPSERATERPDDVAKLLVQAGAAPTLLRVQQDDLETHFLGLIGLEQEETP